MNTLALQRPIGSGFGHRTTAAEVLSPAALGGADLTGFRALVTGGYSGLGLETVRALSAVGALSVVPARRPAEAAAATAGLDGVSVWRMDLADLDSVAATADGLLAEGRSFDAVILAAGVAAVPETRVGANWELHFAVNHLGHYALVNRVLPLLRPGARVVSVSSSGHHLSPVRWDDPQFTTGYDKWLAYAQSKTANALFALHLDQLARDAGIRAFSLHPGEILTPLVRHLSRAEMVGLGWVDDHGTLVDPNFKTPQQGAATQVWAATSPRLAGLGGLYLEDCDVALPAPADGAQRGVREHAADPAQAERLWRLSAELTGVDAFSA